MNSTNVGFVGLGIMGAGMARNLVAAGFDTVVWNRTASKAAAFAEEHGAAVAATPVELAAASDVIVVCVSDTPDVVASSSVGGLPVHATGRRSATVSRSGPNTGGLTARRTGMAPPTA